MPSTLTLYAFAWLALAIIPGPTTLLTLTNGFTKNKILIGSGIIGATISDVTLILAASIGLGALLSASQALFSLVKWIGVAYLAYLAWKLWNAKPHTLLPSGANTWPQTHTPQQAFLRSLLVTISNPKGLLFFSAFLPQFIELNTPLAPQYFAFAITTALIDILVMTCYATGGIQLAKLLTTSGIKKLNRCCAAFMAFLAAGLALYRKTPD